LFAFDFGKGWCGMGKKKGVVGTLFDIETIQYFLQKRILNASFVDINVILIRGAKFIKVI